MGPGEPRGAVRARGQPTPPQQGHGSSGVQGPHPSAPRPNSSLPRERNCAESGRTGGWICPGLALSKAPQTISSRFLVCWGHQESLGGVGDSSGSAFPPCPAVPGRILPPGEALQAQLPNPPAGGDTLPFGSPRAGESRRAGTACPAGAPGSLGSLTRSSQHGEPPGALCAPGRSPCRALLCNSEKRRLFHPQNQPPAAKAKPERFCSTLGKQRWAGRRHRALI